MTVDSLSGDRRIAVARVLKCCRETAIFCAVTESGARLWPMSDETLTGLLAGLQGCRLRGRSDLYRWRRANYKRLVRRVEQNEVSWGVLAQEIAAAGLKNRKGLASSADSVQGTRHGRYLPDS